MHHIRHPKSTYSNPLALCGAEVQLDPLGDGDKLTQWEWVKGWRTRSVCKSCRVEAYKRDEEGGWDE